MPTHCFTLNQALPIDWCRRRDSNSHSFRHRPLKTACLPISPRRPRSLSSSQRLNYVRTQLQPIVQLTHNQNHFGISVALEGSPSAGTAGADSTLEGWTGIALSIMPPLSVLLLERYVSPRLVMKNTAASAPVVLLRKFAEPLAPNRLPDEPLPKAAPISAPFPCCSKTRTITLIADTT